MIIPLLSVHPKQDDVATQNADLKLKMCEANETILQMGLMFLKMKFSKGHQEAALTSK